MDKTFGGWFVTNSEPKIGYQLYICNKCDAGVVRWSAWLMRIVFPFWIFLFSTAGQYRGIEVLGVIINANIVKPPWIKIFVYTLVCSLSKLWRISLINILCQSLKPPKYFFKGLIMSCYFLVHKTIGSTPDTYQEWLYDRYWRIASIWTWLWQNFAPFFFFLKIDFVQHLTQKDHSSPRSNLLISIAYIEFHNTNIANAAL